MDTSKSQAMAGAFLAKNQPYRRRTVYAQRLFHATPDVVFLQFCPVREADWIDGWEAGMIYSATGYAEPKCIFTTPDSNVLGPGLWIFTRLEPYSLLEAVRIIDNNVVEHFRIDLEDHHDGTCTGRWTMTFTALNEKGNGFVDSLPEDDPLFDKITAGLDHFVTTGQLMSIG